MSASLHFVEEVSTCFFIKIFSEHLTPSYCLLFHMTFIENSIEDFGHLLLKICWRHLYIYWRYLSTLYLSKVSKCINICTYRSLAALCSMSRGLYHSYKVGVHVQETSGLLTELYKHIETPGFLFMLNMRRQNLKIRITYLLVLWSL